MTSSRARYSDRNLPRRHLDGELEGRLCLSPAKLKAKAYDLLSRRDHSQKELRDKLVAIGGLEADVASLLDKLRQARLLDDTRFARGFVSYRAGKLWGYRRYFQELEARGVNLEAINEALEELSSEMQIEKIRGFIRKELACGRDHTKIAAALLRRGFSSSEVWGEIKLLATEYRDEKRC